MTTAVATSVRTAAQSEPVHLQRAARALIGWMRQADARASLAGLGAAPSSEHDTTIARAHAAVAARPEGINQAGVITAAPPELLTYVEQLRQNAASIPFFNEGWTVAVVDLERVVAFQHHVATDDATQRVADIYPADLVEIAAVTLPLGAPTSLAAAYNGDKKAWVFSSANPNLRILGEAQGEAQGARIFGFAVGLLSSFVQVASLRGRLLLRDGYHRAYGLLARGITRVSVFFREFERVEDIGVPAGMLTQDSYLGSRPPTLADYFNDAVSANGLMPVTQKVLIVQALEVATLG